MNQQKLDSNYIKQQIKLFRIAALILGAAILFFACENSTLEEIKAFSSPENLPVLEASDFETLITDSGVIRYQVKAPKVLRFETEKDAYLEFPEGVELIRFDENHNITSSLTANYAKQFVAEKKWEAKNNVIATNTQGDTLKTEHLIYEEEKDKIYTEEFVRIIKPDQIITGVGFQSDQSLQNWRIKNPKGTIYVTTENTGKEDEKIVPETPDTTETKESRPFKDEIEFK